MKKFITILLITISFNSIAQEENSPIKITIQTPTNNQQLSVEFYESLNYTVISHDEPTVVTDGKMLIEINPDRFARAGVKFYKDSWRIEIEKLKKLTNVYTIEDGFMLNDLNGCWIYLMESNLNIDFTPSDSQPKGITGNFMGLSLESPNMKKSLEIWEALDFSITTGAIEKGFVIIKNKSGFSVSMMKPLTCPHLFFNPSLTFFNGKENLDIIDKIRRINIPITEEITRFNKDGIVDNIIIRDPGGLGFFIFND